MKFHQLNQTSPITPELTRLLNGDHDLVDVVYSWLAQANSSIEFCAEVSDDDLDFQIGVAFLFRIDGETLAELGASLKEITREYPRIRSVNQAYIDRASFEETIELGNCDDTFYDSLFEFLGARPNYDFQEYELTPEASIQMALVHATCIGGATTISAFDKEMLEETLSEIPSAELGEHYVSLSYEYHHPRTGGGWGGHTVIIKGSKTFDDCRDSAQNQCIM